MNNIITFSLLNESTNTSTELMRLVLKYRHANENFEIYEHTVVKGKDVYNVVDVCSYHSDFYNIFYGKKDGYLYSMAKSLIKSSTDVITVKCSKHGIPLVINAIDIELNKCYDNIVDDRGMLMEMYLQSCVQEYKNAQEELNLKQQEYQETLKCWSVLNKQDNSVQLLLLTGSDKGAIKHTKEQKQEFIKVDKKLTQLIHVIGGLKTKVQNLKGII